MLLTPLPSLRDTLPRKGGGRAVAPLRPQPVLAGFRADRPCLGGARALRGLALQRPHPIGDIALEVDVAERRAVIRRLRGFAEARLFGSFGHAANMGGVTEDGKGRR